MVILPITVSPPILLSGVGGVIKLCDTVVSPRCLFLYFYSMQSDRIGMVAQTHPMNAFGHEKLNEITV